MKKVLFLLLLISCSTRKIANYKVTPYGTGIYRYTKPSEPKKDVFSNGDTLVTTADTMYIIKQRQ